MAVAFTYPGQGSQQPHSGHVWVHTPSWQLVERAAEVSEIDVAELLLTTEGAELTDTLNAQLSTFVLSQVVTDAVRRAGVNAQEYAGHSLGEYSALAAGGVISFDDGVRLVTARGRAMRSASEENRGTMAAIIGLDDEQVLMACEHSGGEVWVANYNAPGQVVIAGTHHDVDRAGAKAKAIGARSPIALSVAGAFHTPHMSPAQEPLDDALDNVAMGPGSGRVWANVDAQPHGEPSEWPALLSAQLCSPVRWRHIVESLVGSDVDVLVELGPGEVLTGMAKRISKGTQRFAVSSPDDVEVLAKALL